MIRSPLRLAAVLAGLSCIAATPAPADWRTPDPQNVLVIDTSKGRILVEMVPEAAPNHVARVRELAKRGFYDNRAFFRVIDNFMAQTGDPQDNGEGSSELPDLTAEFTFRRGAGSTFASVGQRGNAEMGFVGPLPVLSQTSLMMALMADGKVPAYGLFCPGVAGMARGGEPDSANSQFFLMRQAYPSLDAKYTAWGRVIAGLPVVRAIKTGEPVTPPQDQMLKVRVLGDMPANERPTVRVIDTRGAWFKSEAERVRAAKGAEYSACDFDIPSEVK